MLGSTSPIQMLQGIMGSQQNLMPHQIQAFVDKMSEATTARKATAGDTVTISYPASMLQQLLNAEMKGPDSVDGGESDLTGMAQLKMQGDMIAGMIKMRLKNFETSLMTGLKNSGVDPSQSMELKDGGKEGLLLTGATQNDPFQQFLRKNDGLQDQFKEIAQLVDLLNVLRQAGGGTEGNAGNSGLSALLSGVAATGTGGLGPGGLPTPGAQYAKQSNVSNANSTIRPASPQPSARFIVRVMQGRASYGIEGS